MIDGTYWWLLKCTQTNDMYIGFVVVNCRRLTTIQTRPIQAPGSAADRYNREGN